MEKSGADDSKEGLLGSPDCGNIPQSDHNSIGMENDASEPTSEQVVCALPEKGAEISEGLLHYVDELEHGVYGTGFIMEAGSERLGHEQVHPDVVAHSEFLKYGIDELLGLWEASVRCEKTWNCVFTALSPHMEEMYEMQAMPDTKFQRRRGKNSERRQRFKAKREAMHSISRNEQDSDNSQQERTDEGFEDTTGVYRNIRKSGVCQVGTFQHRNGPFKARHYHDDSDEIVESFQPQAFAVDGEPNFESGEPEDGWEYLRRVIWEAARCPKVVVANIDPEKLVSEQTPYMPEIPAITPCPPELLPSKDWEKEFMADFTHLRMELVKLHAPLEASSERLPSVRNRAAWEILCFGAVTSTQAEDLEESGSVTIDAYCGAYLGPEDIDGATEDESLDIHPTTAGISDKLESTERVDIDIPSSIPSSEDLEGRLAGSDNENKDSINLGPQAGTVDERPDLVERYESQVSSALGSSEALGDSSCLHDPAEDSSVSFEQEGSSVVTAELGIFRKSLSDVSDQNESLPENFVYKVTFSHFDPDSSDFQEPVVPLVEATGLEVKLEEEVSPEYEETPTAAVWTTSCFRTSDVAEPVEFYAAATEYVDAFDQYSEPCGRGVDYLNSADISESLGLSYKSIDLRDDDVTNEYREESTDVAAHTLEAAEVDGDQQTADLMDSRAGFEIYPSKNLLEESEDECRESISEIDESLQRLFTRVFRADKAWELPLIHTLLRLDVVSRAALFRFHVSWLDSVEDLPQERALWLLGLAAVVDTPLNGDTTASFRAMLRYCAGIRASKQGLHDEELHMLNALITVAGLYFGQAEAELT